MKASFVNQNHISHQAALSILKWFCNSISHSWAMVQHSHVQTLAPVQSPNDHKPCMDPVATSDVIPTPSKALHAAKPSSGAAQIGHPHHHTQFQNLISLQLAVDKEMAMNVVPFFFFPLFFVARTWHWQRITLVLKQQLWVLPSVQHLGYTIGRFCLTEHHCTSRWGPSAPQSLGWFFGCMISS